MTSRRNELDVLAELSAIQKVAGSWCDRVATADVTNVEEVYGNVRYLYKTLNFEEGRQAIAPVLALAKRKVNALIDVRERRIIDADDVHIKLLKPVSITDDDPDHITSRHVVVLPHKCTQIAAKRLLAKHINHTCNCEFDCCGHLSTYISSVRRIKRHEWAITIDHVRNI